MHLCAYVGPYKQSIAAGAHVVQHCVGVQVEARRNGAHALRAERALGVNEGHLRRARMRAALACASLV